mgnify:CR=1 FL=1
MLFSKGIKEFSLFMSLMRKRFAIYIIGLIGRAIVSVGLNIIIAFIMKDLFDAAVNGKMSLLLRALILVVSASVLVCIFSKYFSFMYNKCIILTMSEIRFRVYKQIGCLPMKYYENSHSGDAVSKITNDIQAVEQGYSGGLYSLIYSLLYGIGSIATMFYLDYRAAVFLLIYGLASTLVNVLMTKPLRNVSNSIQEQYSVLTQRLVDLLNGIWIIKIFNISNISSKLFSSENKKWTELSDKRNNRDSLLRSLNFFLNRASFITVVILGIYMILNNAYNFGTIVAMIQLATNVNKPFVELGGYVSSLQTSLAGFSRINRLLSEQVEAETHSSSLVESLSKEYIKFDEVSFCYDSSRKVLDRLSLNIEKGQVVALVGLSGGGKSSIMKLLMGFYSEYSGEIYIENKNIRDYSLSDLRDISSYVSQESYLFNGTIADNIKYGSPNASRNEIISAAKSAYAHEFVLEQLHGYETLVGEKGSRLSGGERQRIAIARALLKNAPILLLDEATASLDSQSEALIQMALSELIKNRTVLVIAHRLSTIEKADMICVIDKGRVVECENHLELIKLNGIYKSLFDLQLG